MTNAIATLQDWQKKMELEAMEAFSSEKPGSSTMISIGEKTFMMGSDNLGDEIHVIILASAFENAYYDRPWSPDETSPPACFAISGEVRSNDELIPNETSPDIQSDACATCHFNEYGSALQGKGKRCRNARRIAICAFGDDGLDTSKIGIIRVPPTSLKPMGAYFKSIAAKYKRPTYGVVTKLSFDQKVRYPLVQCEFMGLIDDPSEFQAIDEAMPEAKLMVSKSYNVEDFVPITKPKKSKMS